MIRVSIGPRANTAMVLVSGLFLVNAWFAAATGDKTVATIWVAAAVFVLVDITSSLKQRACALACASGLVVLSLAFAAGPGHCGRVTAVYGPSRTAPAR